MYCVLSIGYLVLSSVYRVLRAEKYPLLTTKYSLPNTRYPLLIILLLYSINLSAGDIVVRRVSVAEQLPSNTVYRMFHDSEGYVWLGTQNGFCRYDGYGMKSFRSEITRPAFPSNNITGDFAEDTLNHTIWIGTEKGALVIDQRSGATAWPDTVPPEGDSPVRQILYDNGAMWVCSDLGLYLYNPDRTLRKKYLSGANSIHIDRDGVLRVTVWNDGIYYLDRKSDIFVQYPQKIGAHNNPHRIFQDREGRFWVCTWGDGLYRFYPHREPGEIFERIIIPDSKDLDFGIFFDIEQDDVNGYIWVLSYAGLTVFKPEGERIRLIDEPAATINEQTNLFADIMKDRNGNIWIGTYEQGAMVIDPAPSAVTNFDLQSIKAETRYIPNISQVFEDSDGELWLRAERLGIYLLNPRNSATRKAGVADIRYATSICRCSTLDEIWVATEYLNNIFRLRKSKGKIEMTGVIDMMSITGEAQSASFLHEDRQGDVWAAAGKALFRWRRGKWQQIGDEYGTITGITEDRQGNIWLSSSERGLWQIAGDSASAILVKNYNTANSAIAGNHISCLSAGAGQSIWFCANENQLCQYDHLAARFTDHTGKANIENHVILNILAGDDGHIWISSNRQVVEFNPATGASFQFDTEHDMAPNSLNRNAVAKLRNGSVAFCGNQGCSILSPSDRLDQPCTKTPTAITGIKINGAPIHQHDPSRQKQYRMQELELNHNEANIEIDFSSFNYLNPGKTRYAYKLEGIDRQWVHTRSNRNFAVYNQLRKGTYTFSVKSTGDNQLWSDSVTTLIIIKQPAIYETNWAYTCYAIALLFLLFAGLRIYVSRIRLRNELHIVQIDKNKSEELIQTKLRFFTNIGHEFRTPLTLIITPLTTIIRQLADEKLKQSLSSIHRNAEDLLRLINQLLDFRKLEMGGEKLKLSCNDFVKFVEYVHLTFKDLAANKSISFTLSSGISRLFMGFDKSKLRKVINNLYSNALKFTPEGGYISTTIEAVQQGENEFVRLDVEDSGCGIAEEEYRAIFDRFYQSRSNEQDKIGSGIGLHLVKEYVELHGGWITVSSKLGEGSLFSVYIPADLSVAGDSDTDDKLEQAPIPSREESTGKASEQKTLLIVEDNAELRHFLMEQFGENFRMMQAANGKEAIDAVAQTPPDLIVCDLMMPVLNGLDLCMRLKNDIQTSHIPIVMLTAKISDETKIEAYRAGADSYIAKPFNFDVLLTRVEMLIEQQEKRRKLFHKTIEISPSTITTTSLDEELIRKALLSVETNIDNSEYSVDDLASALAMSRRQLSRKLQSIIGLSPAEFIRSVRLKRAAQLLRDSQYNISEIAYMVGFNTIKYFNLNFKDEFGATPTQYRNFANQDSRNQEPGHAQDSPSE